MEHHENACIRDNSGLSSVKSNGNPAHDGPGKGETKEDIMDKKIKTGFNFTNTHGVECIVRGPSSVPGFWSIEMYRGLRQVGNVAMTNADIMRETHYR